MRIIPSFPMDASKMSFSPTSSRNTPPTRSKPDRLRSSPALGFHDPRTNRPLKTKSMVASRGGNKVLVKEVFLDGIRICPLRRSAAVTRCAAWSCCVTDAGIETKTLGRGVPVVFDVFLCPSRASRRPHRSLSIPYTALNLPASGYPASFFTGARRGEIRGLLWENYHDGETQITRSIWRGHITEPKTRMSRGAIPVIAPLAKRLEFHRIRCGNPTSGVMFPNLNGSPMELGNLLNRIILPTLNRCAILWQAEGRVPEAEERPARHARSCV